MPRPLPFALLMVACACVVAPALAAEHTARGGTLRLEDVVSLKRPSALTWSRDGQRLAFVVEAADTAEDTNNQDLWMWDAATNQCRRLTRFPKNDYSPTFSPGGDTLAFLSARGTGEDLRPQIQFLPLRGGEPWAFAPQAESVGEIRWSPDGRSIAFTLLDTLPKQVREWRKKKWDQVTEDERLQYNHLWVLDVASGQARRLTSGAFNVAAPQWAPDSRMIACIVNPTGKVDDGNLSDIALIDPASGNVRRLDVLPGGGEFAWSPDSRWLAWAGGSNRRQFVAKQDLWVVAAAGGVPMNLTREFDESGQSPCWSRGSDTLYFHADLGASTVLARVPRAGGKVTLAIDRDGEATMPIAAANGRVAWIQSGAKSPNEVWVAERIGQRGRPVSQLNTEAAQRALGDTRLVHWTSSDGVRIEGVLLRPAGAGNGALKTLVLLHGGPYGARYALGFQVTAQYMAAHGYQVFMPNFRSSGGYGTKFMIRERADWGGQDWRDVMTGIDTLIASGLADGKRLGVFGHSYGGYLSAWAITQTDRFKAAVVSAGAVDLPALWAESDTHQYRAFEFEGEPWKSFDLWRRDSPIAQIQKVMTPTLILNGEADVRIPYPQAQETYQSLTALGIPCEFVHYPREGHGIREPHHFADWLSRQAAWFDRWIR